MYKLWLNRDAHDYPLIIFTSDAVYLSGKKKKLLKQTLVALREGKTPADAVDRDAVVIPFGQIRKVEIDETAEEAYSDIDIDYGPGATESVVLEFRGKSAQQEAAAVLQKMLSGDMTTKTFKHSLTRALFYPLGMAAMAFLIGGWLHSLAERVTGGEVTGSGKLYRVLGIIGPNGVKVVAGGLLVLALFMLAHRFRVRPAFTVLKRGEQRDFSRLTTALKYAFIGAALYLFAPGAWRAWQTPVVAGIEANESKPEVLAKKPPEESLSMNSALGQAEPRQKKIIRVAGSSKPVSALAFSRNGSRYAIGAENGRILVWDTASGKTEADFQAPNKRIISVAFDQTGNRLLTVAEGDNAARVWPLTPGQNLLLIKGAKAAEYAGLNLAVFSPDGESVAVFDEAGVRIVDVASGKTRISFTGLGGTNGSDLAFSPDGKLLAATDVSGKVLIWNTETGQPSFEVAAPALLSEEDEDGVYRHIRFRPDNSLLLVFDYHEAVLWDVAKGEMVGKLNGFQVSDGEMFADFSGDGKTIAASAVKASSDDEVPVIGLWDVKTRRLVRKLGGGLRSEAGLLAGVFLPKGDSLVCALEDNSIRIIGVDGKSGRELLPAGEQSVYALRLSVSPDGRYVSIPRGVTTRIVGLAPDAADIVIENAHSPVQVAYGPSGQRIISRGADGRVRMKEISGNGTSWIGTPGPVSVVEFSPDGKRVVTETIGLTQLWDTETGKLVAVLADIEKDRDVGELEFSADGRFLAVYDGVDTVLLDARTGERLKVLEHVARPEFSFTPDGRHLISQSINRVFVLNTEERRIGAEFGNSLRAEGVYLSPDGSTFVLLTNRYAAELWDVKTKKRIAQLQEISRPQATRVRYRPDGQQVIVTDRSSDMATLWDASSGAKLADIPVGKGVADIRFNHAGSRFVCIRENGSVSLWAADGKQLLVALDSVDEWVESKLALSPDGKTFAIHRRSGGVILLNTESAAVTPLALDKNASLTDMAFSRDGHQLVTAIDGQKAKIWETQSGKLLVDSF